MRLAADILRSVEGPPEAFDDDAWLAELRSRAERVLRGEVKGRPWNEVRDDMVAELAVASGADAIITHNLADFAGTERFGVRCLAPSEFLRHLVRR